MNVPPVNIVVVDIVMVVYVRRALVVALVLVILPRTFAVMNDVD